MNCLIKAEMFFPGGGAIAHLQGRPLIWQTLILWIVCCVMAGNVGAQCDVTLTNHDGTMDNAYAWVYSGDETAEQGSFAECFTGDFTICQLQVHLSQVGNANGDLPNQTFDVFVWQDDGTGSPGAVISQTLAVDPGLIAQWPLFSRHDIGLSVPVSGDWWIGVRRNDLPSAASWLIAADESGPTGCSRANIGPGQGYPIGWSPGSQISFMSNCSSFGIQVVGTQADIEEPPSCGSVLANHDLTLENAYGWVPNGSETGEQGAFAECFHAPDGTVFTACGVEFYFTQTGNQGNQTMDVYVWENSPTSTPGDLVLHLENIDPGTVATWPEVSRFDLPLELNLTGEWWVGWRGNWTGDSPGWMNAADENGPGGCSLTNVGPGHGYPIGWNQLAVVPAWAQCKSLGIRTVGTSAATSSVEPELGPLVPWCLLEQNAPNPFNPSTTLSFELASPSHARLTIYDAAGRMVTVLLDEHQFAGRHSVVWDGVDARGNQVASGVYLYQIEAGDFVDTKRMTLLK